MASNGGHLKKKPTSVIANLVDRVSSCAAANVKDSGISGSSESISQSPIEDEVKPPEPIKE